MCNLHVYSEMRDYLILAISHYNDSFIVDSSLNNKVNMVYKTASVTKRYNVIYINILYLLLIAFVYYLHQGNIKFKFVCSFVIGRIFMAKKMRRWVLVQP